MIKLGERRSPARNTLQRAIFKFFAIDGRFDRSVFFTKHVAVTQNGAQFAIIATGFNVFPKHSRTSFYKHCIDLHYYITQKLKMQDMCANFNFNFTFI